MNLLLEALPQAERKTIEDNLESAPLERGDVLFEVDSKIDRIYFVDSGVISLVSVMSDGTTAEITTVGREGLVNIGSLLDDDLAIARHTVQVPGTARWLRSDTFRSIVKECPPVRRMSYRYAQAMISQISQSVACNNLHGVEERLARWLLMTHDRSDGDELHLTQEFVAEMLGVRRPTVTLVARTFQTAGLIRYRRGRIEILDRTGLEEAACECHAIMARHYKRLLPQVDF